MNYMSKNFEAFNENNSEESKEKINSKVILHFIRHSKADAKKEGDTDELREISPEGKQIIADKLFKNDKPAINAVSFGSLRVRSGQTAALLMENNPELLSMNNDELSKYINRDLLVGSKIGIDKRLDYNDDDDFSSSPAYGEKIKSHFTKDYLKYIVQESDKDAKDMGYKGIFTYSGMAANIASIIDKYVTVSGNWDRLVNEPTKPQESKILERFLGTHQGVTESFLAKIIERKNGVEARDKFVLALDNQGFDLVEGFDVSINTSGLEKKILLDFCKKTPDGNEFSFHGEITPEELDYIINQA